MKNKLIIFYAVTLLCAPGAWAQEAMTSNSVPVIEPQALEVMVPNVGNKFCPVSKKEIGSVGEPVQIEHNGKMYNLCCPMCVKDFQSDPDKYSKIADDEVAQSQGSMMEDKGAMMDQGQGEQQMPPAAQGY
ncbi:MAG: hypothetical protein Q7S13_04480 [Candidatus Omnitrophota bacterium]|nr:hypothetical protein [Candidatus Omnitrophota bacterium]